eukprot:CAMPEP_0204247276 /NCGR_PEP_ID=MMETSP0361-20130328/98567_1 /ASSEMBLY_ACC=CAM_ASM_000343 /TAXON_ID=268821 /ORGANISM="Scrippsiella Hangoei, Strain SHTV-5" /LENGTH=372 /DNA_ID=CAMNT_0051220509 /DNA_START=71 /DNA_END=1189 /DNA_ORIENTATION=-
MAMRALRLVFLLSAVAAADDCRDKDFVLNSQEDVMALAGVQIANYRGLLRQRYPDPRPCDRGPGRAIQTGQLLDFLAYFQAFVKYRAMYYIVSNIVEPLTALDRLSFAELAGPGTLDWFVSHFWGHAFGDFCSSIQNEPLTALDRLSFAELAGPGTLDWFVSHFWGHAFGDFCSSIQNHAQVVCGADARADAWRLQRYWICSFSNNQHRIQDEMGEGWKMSSFYLALLHQQRRGTCLVLDEEALPLTRSWCLFEVAQTVEMEKLGDPDHHGLVFCTRSGVVNHGSASVEVSLGLASRLATLLFQDAKASVQKDHDDIKDFVVNKMGGFDKMNAAIRERISDALMESEQVVLTSFQTITSSLQRSVSVDTLGS